MSKLVPRLVKRALERTKRFCTTQVQGVSKYGKGVHAGCILAGCATTYGVFRTLIWYYEDECPACPSALEVFKDMPYDDIPLDRDLPSIGGSFSLINGDRQIVSSCDFADKFLLVYFGFSNCPKVCPRELMKLSAVLELMDSMQETTGLVKGIFITVDPSRDTPEILKEYSKKFYKDIQFLTHDDPKTLREVAAGFKVFTTMQPGGSDKEYLLDHSALIYLLKGDKLLDFFAENAEPEHISFRVTKHIARQLNT